MKIPRQVEIVEVAPRDGLQNLSVEVSTSDKINLVNAIAKAGLARIEVTTFAHPKWVPQLRDAEEVLAGIEHSGSTRIMILLPNLRGYERARRCLGQFDEVSVVVTATETMNRKNVNSSIADSMKEFEEIVRQAKGDGLRVRGSIGVAFVCPYEGRTPPEQTLRLVRDYFRIGVDEVLLADTIGLANPAQVYDLVSQTKKEWPNKVLALHFHDTYNMALANSLAGLQAGVVIFDSSVGGLGGCPFAPRAAGNVATEKLVFMLHEMGVRTGIDKDELLKVAEFAQGLSRTPS